MPNKTGIEYVQYTSNPIYAVRLDNDKRGWHCVHASPGCEHCYAEALNKRWGTGLTFVAQNDDKIRFGLSMKEIDALLALDARLQKRGETARVFVGDMLDIFHKTVPDFMLAEFFGALERCTALTILTLTKRAGRQRDFLSKRWAGKEPPARIHVGVSAEDQRRADERIPLLLQTPAAVRWISAEPLLAPLDISLYLASGFEEPPHDDVVGWVVVGGESGAGARYTYVENVRGVTAQCEAAGVPVFVKQLGSRPVVSNLTHWRCPAKLLEDGSGYLLKLKDGKGGDVSEFPADLRVRQMPEVAV